jgi:hypothetical protein
MPEYRAWTPAAICIYWSGTWCTTLSVIPPANTFIWSHAWVWHAWVWNVAWTPHANTTLWYFWNVAWTPSTNTVLWSHAWVWNVAWTPSTNTVLWTHAWMWNAAWTPSANTTLWYFSWCEMQPGLHLSIQSYDQLGVTSSVPCANGAHEKYMWVCTNECVL